MQTTTDFHAEFAPMANNRESVHDLNDNVPVVEIMANFMIAERTKMLAEAVISSAASTSAATRVKKAHSTPNGKLLLPRRSEVLKSDKFSSMQRQSQTTATATATATVTLTSLSI
jgi:hypothetical protein